MKWFYNMKLSAKLISGFILVALIAGIIGFVGVRNIQAISEADTLMYKQLAVPLAELVTVSTSFQRIRVNSRDLIDVPTEAERRDKINRIAELREEVLKNVESVEKTMLTQGGREANQKFLTEFKRYVMILDQVSELARANRPADARALLSGEGERASAEAQQAIAKLVELKDNYGRNVEQNNNNLAVTAVRTMMILIGIGMLVAVGLGLFIARAISRPVNEMVAAANRLALGDVNVSVQAETKDEIGMLAQAFQAMIANIRNSAFALEKVAAGDLNVDIRIQSEKDVLGKNLEHMVATITELLRETDALIKSSQEGQLSTRGNAAAFAGDWRKLLEGINRILDAVLQPINEAAAILQEMAKGNLDVQVKGDYQGDHAMIKQALNTTLDAINDILNQVTISVDQVTAGARQVSDSSQSLSQGATQSASAVEEVSSSMHEMSSQISQNAENANQANLLAVAARDNAEKGNGRMNDMVKAMADINHSANNISKIIKVIDEIAFQTNLLALNAAVEAARAGKHGKGFTVVAEEVRNLAQRSAKAANETTEMIEDSIKKTEVGTTIAQDTSQALVEIVTGATKVTDLISEIAAASREQAKGINQINQALGQVDQVTQQNTAAAEESAAAAEELSSQSTQLKGMLSKFNLRKLSTAAGGFAGIAQITPQMLEMLEQMMQKQRQDGQGFTDASPAGKVDKKTAAEKPEGYIALDDTDFGKF